MDKKRIIKKIESTKFGNRYVNDPRYRTTFSATFSFAFNMFFSLYNVLLGHFSNTNWYIILGIYYFVLSVMRLSAVLHEKKANQKREFFVMRFSGALLIELSTILGAMVLIDAKKNMATKYHEIVMITIALYTFTKLTLAIINAVKVRKTYSPVLITIRNISCADAAASILALQRSMFASFGDSSAKDVYIMNIFTGVAAFLFVLVMGIYMLTVKKEKFYKKKEAQR